MVYNIHRDILSVSFSFPELPPRLLLWGLFRYPIYHISVWCYTRYMRDNKHTKTACIQTYVMP
nr:MAG TPA: hypothetical protein [Caudoviricetes sp.]